MDEIEGVRIMLTRPIPAAALPVTTLRRQREN